MQNQLFNINIERALLGSILFEPSLYEDVVSILKAEDFYLPFHKEIFIVMEELYRADEPIDEEFVKEKLQLKKKFDEKSFLEILATNPLSSVNAYAKDIKEKAIKRELIHFAGEIRKTVDKEDISAVDIIDVLQSKLYKITQESTSKDFRDSKDIITSALSHMWEMKAKGNSLLVGLDTGFANLNTKTAGFSPGDLIIIAARPSMGKTAFALNIAQHILDQNKGVVIFSLEMPAEHLFLRMLSAKASIPLQKLRTGDLLDSEWSEISRLCEEYMHKKFFVDDEGLINIHQLRAKLRKLKSKHSEIELAIIDYLQLMSGGSQKDRHLEISEISRGLKLLARELNIPIIALSQLNRSLESRDDKRPMLSDLRESGAIEQDADIILFIYRDDVYRLKELRKKAQKSGQGVSFEEKKVERAEIIIGKQRNGPTGVILLSFHKEHVRFAEEETEIERKSFEAKSTEFEIM
jgi:replicative DNA helicase